MLMLLLRIIKKYQLINFFSALILESKAMLDQVNRFQGRAKTGGWQSRKKMQAAANLISRDPRTPKDEMLILQNAPKKSKSKRASDSR